MLGTGTGSELRQPLGYAMVGGLILSQALTLYTTPVVFIYLERVNRWLQGHSPKHAADTAMPERRPANDGYALAPDLKRSAARARAFAASVSRSRGGALLTSECSRAPPAH